ncbi:MAG TPA: hypothetical protein VMV69_16385 [Pirellulales bacterium]|nr:hypothetical protein [Pirellulales bacterium]
MFRSSWILTVCLTALAFRAAADDDGPAPETQRAQDHSAPKPTNQESQEARRASRLKMMRDIVGRIQLESGDGDERTTLELLPEPRLRYSDAPHHGLEDATVWLWRRGERPAALLKLESYPSAGGPIWSFCMTSVSSGPVAARFEGGKSWSAKSPGISPQWLPGAAPPSENPERRPRQMREIARRFTAYRRYGELGRTELRLLARPVYRYKSEAEGITDGAIFCIVKDTNPHVLLLVESFSDGDTPRWRYSPVRHADAECHLLLDGLEVWQADERAGVDPRQPYYWFQVPATAAGDVVKPTAEN